ncbi:MAG: hypothetical protein ACXVEF_40090 [Polyangiales bacterium]
MRGKGVILVTLRARCVGLTVLAVVFGGCTFDDPPAAEPDGAFVDDATTESSVSVPNPSVLVDGTDMPADLACLGKPRDGGMIHEAGPSDVGSDSAATDSALDAFDATSLDSAADTLVASDGAADALDASDGGVDGTAPVGDGDISDASPVTVGTLHPETVEVVAFGTGGVDKLPGETIDLFWSNSFKGAPDVVGVVTDSKGLLNATLPYGIRVAYHVRASATVGDFYGMDDIREVLAGDMYPRFQGVTHDKFKQLALAVTGDTSYVLPPKTGIVTARVVDCAHRNLHYASIRLVDLTDGAGSELPFGKCGDGLCLLYLSDTELPDLGATFTSRSGLIAMVQVPTGRKLRVIAEGYRDGTTRFEVGHRDLEVQDGAITNVFIEPNNP